MGGVGGEEKRKKDQISHIPSLLARKERRTAIEEERESGSFNLFASLGKRGGG